MVRLPGLCHLTEVRRRFGLLAGLQGLAYGIVRKLCFVQVNRVLLIRVGHDAAELKTVNGRFLTADEVVAFSVEPSNDLDSGMYRRLSGGLDRCFAAVSGRQLVNYSWYASGSIEAAHFSGVPASFPGGTAYFYKSFTHPDFRGRGINQAVIQQALSALAKHDVEQVFGLVEFNNWSSLRSCRKVGFRTVGWLVTFGAISRRAWPSRGVRKLGIRLGRQAQVVSRST